MIGQAVHNVQGPGTPWFSHYSSINHSLFKLPFHWLAFIVLQFQSNPYNHQSLALSSALFKGCGQSSRALNYNSGRNKTATLTHRAVSILSPI